MNSFFDLLRVIVFSNTVILTPAQIDIEPGMFEMELAYPVSTITAGAALYIDVSHMLPDDVEGISRAREWVKKTFPEGTISATLSSSAETQDAALLYSGESAWSEGKVVLILPSASELPKNVEFDKINFETEVALLGVVLAWKNHKK